MIFQSKLNNFQYNYEDVKNEGFISGTVKELEKELTTVFVPRLVVKIKYEGHKVCTNCEQPKMLSEFYKAIKHTIRNMEKRYYNESNHMTNRKTFKLYNRKLAFCKSLGFEFLYEAITHFGNHRKFNKEFDKVAHEYPAN